MNLGGHTHSVHCNRFIFQRSFRFIEKLSRKYREFPRTPYLQCFPLLLTSGVSIAIDEPVGSLLLCILRSPDVTCLPSQCHTEWLDCPQLRCTCSVLSAPNQTSHLSYHVCASVCSRTPRSWDRTVHSLFRSAFLAQSYIFKALPCLFVL